MTILRLLQRAARAVAASPGISAATIITLGLGLGATTSVFAVFDRLLLSPPAGLVDADRLRTVSGSERDQVQLHALTFPDVQVVADSELFDLAPFAARQQTATTVNSIVIPSVSQMVGHEYFSVLGVRPTLGRAFTEDDDGIGAAPVAIVSFDFWRRHLGSDPSALGRPIEVEGTAYSVVGVMPEGVSGVDIRTTDVWLPLRPTLTDRLGTAEWLYSRDYAMTYSVLRLRDGVRETQALAEVSSRYASAQIRSGRPPTLLLDPVVGAMGSREANVASAAQGLALLLLAICCVNVSALLLSHSLARRREWATKLAMGAPRAVIASELAVQVLILTMASAALSIIAAVWVPEAVSRMLLPDFASSEAVNGRLLLFLTLLAVVTMMAAAFGPMVTVTRQKAADVLDALGPGSPAARSRWLRPVIFGQACLTCVLCIVAIPFVRSTLEYRAIDPGLDLDQLAFAEFVPEDPDSSRVESPSLATLVTRVRESPLVRDVAVAGTPFDFRSMASGRVTASPEVPLTLARHSVGDAFFETVGLTVQDGVPMSAFEGRTEIWVSEATADSLWQGRAIGECLIVAGDTACRQVVGVVDNATYGSINAAAGLTFYERFVPDDSSGFGVYVRAGTEPSLVVEQLRAELDSWDVGFRLRNASTLRELLEPMARGFNAGAVLFSVFAGIGLLLTTIGIASVTTYYVSRSRQDLFIRSALGASRSSLFGHIVRRGSIPAILGIACGAIVAWGAAPWIDGMLYRTDPRSPAVFLAAVAGLSLLAIACCAGPALRGTKES